jgi:hypothetical protein
MGATRSRNLTPAGGLISLGTKAVRAMEVRYGTHSLEINTRSPFAQGTAFGDVGPYEQLDGTAYFAVDLNHPRNAGITDLNSPHAMLRAGARDFRHAQARKPQYGNHRLLLDIVNRGNPRADEF